ncbi:hypothetical protein E9228_003237 [Curtobacterium flaccumfaciens]|uniref:Uncharacterized protein n=1 Tax=Curtobacterium salicis TaxID=1779862 RepID=A0ABX0TEG4_9MICO|nr:hypothetical protein [Curtobacterium sp. WW7]NII42568.1 hypothetical protein [Curtobacterium sp. WW7]
MSITAGVLPAADRRRIAALADRSDDALGVRLLRGTPTNEARSEEHLTDLSRRATSFGAALADRASGAPAAITVVERDGGLAQGGLLARYGSREHRVELFTDTVDFCEHLVDELGWRSWFPAGSVQAAAVEHERAHHLVTVDRSRDLRAALGLEVLRIGRFRRFGTVAGADEVAAHAFAARSVRLGRSPLLLTAAAQAALATRTGARRAPTTREN